MWYCISKNSEVLNTSEKEQSGFADCLAFDMEKARLDIVKFVRNELKIFRKDGVLVGLSGGLNSSTVASCASRQ